jgi:type VI secretion system protein ImpE
MSFQVSASGTGASPTPAERLLKAGRLDEALQALTAQVRGNPADAAARVFLFQLLAVGGQWERAETQLQASQQMDASNAVLGAVYGTLLKAERVRAEVFAGTRLPTAIGEPEPWLAMLLQAAKLDAQGQHGQATALRAQAFEQAPAISGRIDAAPFAWLADADPRFGPCLEIVVNGSYGWAPFSNMRALTLQAPASLSDMLWTPVSVAWSNGGETAGFVPTRYPGSETAGDELVRLGRRTEWVQAGTDGWTGVGQRMLATDAGEFPLLDIRQVEFDER